MRKTAIALVICFGILCFLPTSVNAQCWPGRIGGCPSYQAQNLMAGNLAIINGYGGYGNYGGGYYGGRNDLLAVGINTAGYAISNVLMAREQTKQIRAIIGSQPQVVYQQATPQNNGRTYGLSDIKPLFPNNGNGDAMVYDPDSQGAISPAQLEKWTLINGTSGPAKPILIYSGGQAIGWLQPGDSLELTVPMGKMDFRSDGFKPVVNKKNPFRLQDQRIPLVPEKESGRNEITYQWPERIGG